MDPLLIQCIGYLGILSIIISFQQKERATILVWLVIGQVFFSIHFGLLGAWTGLALNLLAISRGLLFYLKPLMQWAQSPLWLYLFIVLCWVGGYLTWEGYHSAFVIIAMTIETIGVWRNSAKEVRWFMLGVRPLYFTYALLVGSYAGMTADVLFSLSLMMSILRYDKRSS